MYGKEVWDKIYDENFGKAPWLNESWAKESIKIISPYFSEKISKSSLVLDYGCGNGAIGIYLNSLGYNVEFAEISHVMVKWLKENKKILMPVHEVQYPKELGTNKYDVVLVWGVFHHIKFDYWTEYLIEFFHIMKEGGIMIIGGWDESDVVLKDEYNIGRFTNESVWNISKLVNYARNVGFTELYNYVEKIEVKPFEKDRSFRVLVIRK